MSFDKQRIAFRTDASLEIGSGHVMRCLTLADALRKKGAECWFICRAHQGNLAKLICTRGHYCRLLDTVIETEQISVDISMPAHASWLGCSSMLDAAQTRAILSELRPAWLVVDHYALDAHWESSLRNYARRIMVIDDLADRPHDCDLLLDQNLGRNLDDYKKQVSHDCKCLIGPHYALLRPEFSELREFSLTRRQQPELKQVLITMGGIDKTNVTCRVLNALNNAPLPNDCRLVVVMGQESPWLTEVNNLVTTLRWPTEVLINASNMAHLMANSDLAIGAAGGTSWERCCLGLPTLMMTIADNQRDAAHHLMSAGAAIYIQETEIETSITHWVNSFAKCPEISTKITNCASRITNGLGVWLVSETMAST